LAPKHNKIDPAVFLGSQGPVATSLTEYESRPQQIEMAEAISFAFKDTHHLMVEAGTGVGKSFAYLIPALQRVVENKQKVLISTYTISLQEQLVKKDIPFIHKSSGIDFVCTLAKGRGNYLCWRRLEKAQTRHLSLFDHPEHLTMLEDIFHWALQTKDGSLSDLPFTPPRPVWEMVCSDESVCMGKHCSRFDNCHFQKARRRMYSSDIIITNHALFFTDLAIRLEGGSILPRYDFVILDEAHNIENVASQHFGLRISNYQVKFLLNRIYNPKTDKGIMASHSHNDVKKLIVRVDESANYFFNQVFSFCNAQKNRNGNGRIKQTAFFENPLSQPLTDLGACLRAIAENVMDEQDRLEIDSYAVRCSAFAYELNQFIHQQIPDSVYWAEAGGRPPMPRTVISAAPLHIGASLQKALFHPCPSVVLTSATLSTSARLTEQGQDENKGFRFFSSRLGLENFKGLQLGSPFDYQRQVRVYVESYLPEPKIREDDFVKAAIEAIKKYLLETQGKAFILFTNFKHLHQAAELLQDFCMEHDFLQLEQGYGKNRSALLEEFRQNINSVLFGTDSFWQGVDVPGESLSNVIIFKLPFSVPDDPLLQARLEQIQKEGGSPFFDYQLPEAVIKFKQGFGRLIRTQKDKGIVVILDPRIVTKNYGKLFLQAIPTCPVDIVTEP
jgi:ATP-dependent DNA helicase DinG